MHDNLLEKYHSLKRRFDRLSKDYDILSDSYDEIRNQYNRLKESSSNIEQMKYDWELMYVMLDNRGLSEKFKNAGMRISKDTPTWKNGWSLENKRVTSIIRKDRLAGMKMSGNIIGQREDSQMYTLYKFRFVVL